MKCEYLFESNCYTDKKHPPKYLGRMHEMHQVEKQKDRGNGIEKRVMEKERREEEEEKDGYKRGSGRRKYERADAKGDALDV